MARKEYPLDYRYAKRNVTEAQYDRLISKIARLKVDVREIARGLADLIKAEENEQ